MEMSKSPKSLAYARLGKANFNKTNTIQQHKKSKRNSTGNFYEQLLEHVPAQANKYIRELVVKNEKEQTKDINDQYMGRRKSYADLVIDAGSKEKNRQQRQTLCKSKFSIQNILIQQQTPKNHLNQYSKKSQFSTKNHSKLIQKTSNNSPKDKQRMLINSFKKPQKSQQNTFLTNLDNYVQQLIQTPQLNDKLLQNSNIKNNEKLSQTLKLNHNQSQNYRLISKLQQSQIKIKQLKLKTYYQQKQLNRFIKKQMKMKQTLKQMLKQIKNLTNIVDEQKKQKRKLQKIIDNFQIGKKQRKTIGKYHKIQDFQNKILQFNQFQNSFKQYQKSQWKYNTKKNKYNINNNNKNFYKKYNDDEEDQERLDSQRIQKLFKSNYNSDQSDN